MFICKICHREFFTAEDVAKHSLKCWKEQNPYRQSKPAPHSENIVERKVNDEILDFFSNIQERK